ncbi:PadR family transcriptional regulator [Kribbella sp. NBC_00709]|uniref:PadR family transcriptional regulator n=1 Tax=Kribbella sp. NBC_00709 TaxID=2975972 RepID=UPI003FA5E13E
MTKVRRPSPQTTKVLSALAAQPERWRYGYELCSELAMNSGSLYPILLRLSERGLLGAMWESDAEPGRPPRHLYRLTDDGMAYAQAWASVSAVAPSRVRLRPQGA